MSRPTSRTFFVAKNATGEWSVKSGGASTSRVFDTKAAALKAARDIVRENGGVLQVTNKDGQTSKSFTLGRSAMTKLNAVEGVVLTAAGKQTFKEFDREGLTPAQRRAKLRKSPIKLTDGVATRVTGGRDQGLKR